MNKEKTTRKITIVIQPTLFEKLDKICQKEYKTMSSFLREIIVKYIQERS
jgi:metal-responsive CopG/Arc/MetJ family transcriptional regulator